MPEGEKMCDEMNLICISINSKNRYFILISNIILDMETIIVLKVLTCIWASHKHQNRLEECARLPKTRPLRENYDEAQSKLFPPYFPV